MEQARVVQPGRLVQVEPQSFAGRERVVGSLCLATWMWAEEAVSLLVLAVASVPTEVACSQDFLLVQYQQMVRGQTCSRTFQNHIPNSKRLDYTMLLEMKLYRDEVVRSFLLWHSQKLILAHRSC